MNYHSQDGQDKFVHKLLGNKQQGFFVDIGAHDGVTFSNTLFFEEELGWKGICVEPNPVVFSRLAANRKSTNLNCCIANDKGIFQFMKVSGWGEMLSGLVPFFDKKQFERIDQAIAEHGGKKEIIDVEAIPMREIFEKYGITEIDYCNIDVEGGEISVLSSIDFSKVKIHLFTIENAYGSTDVQKYLEPLGYRKLALVGADEVFELHSTRYALMLGNRIWPALRQFRHFLHTVKTKIFSHKA